MFERFTEGAIRVIMLAQEEGKRLGHKYVDTEQIMLGLIGDGTGIASKALKASGVSLKAARDGVEAKIGKGNDFVIPPGQPWYVRWINFFKISSREVPFKPRAKKILELSWDEARKLKHTGIGTEHLLLGLISEASLETEGSQGVAIQTLQDMGVDLKILKKKVLELIKKRDETSDT